MNAGRLRFGATRPGSRILSIGILGGLIALWEVAVRVTATPDWFLPPPSAVARALIESRDLLAANTWVTLQEILIGLGVALVVGVAAAIAIAGSPVLGRMVYPLTVTSQAIPIVALAPILLIWFGYGIAPKVIVVALVCFFPITVNLTDGLRGVDPAMIDLLRTMGATRGQIFRVVRLPAELPFLFSGLRGAATVSGFGALIGEWVGASAGLGYVMTRAAAQFLTARLFAAVLVAAALSLALFAVVGWLERWAMPWRRVQRSNGA